MAPPHGMGGDPTRMIAHLSDRLDLSGEQQSEVESLVATVKQTSETDRARRIVLDLLEYARQRELQVKPVKLADVIDKTKTLLGSTLRSHAITLHTDIPDTLYVTADPHRLLQVFINLFLHLTLDIIFDFLHVVLILQFFQ